MDRESFGVVGITEEPLAVVENRPGFFLARLRRPDGTEVLVSIPEEHFQRVMGLANGEFGDKSIILGGPRLVETK